MRHQTCCCSALIRLFVIESPDSRYSLLNDGLIHSLLNTHHFALLIVELNDAIQ